MTVAGVTTLSGCQTKCTESNACRGMTIAPSGCTLCNGELTRSETPIKDAKSYGKGEPCPAGTQHKQHLGAVNYAAAGCEACCKQRSYQLGRFVTTKPYSSPFGFGPCLKTCLRDEYSGGTSDRCFQCPNHKSTNGVVGVTDVSGCLGCERGYFLIGEQCVQCPDDDSEGFINAIQAICILLIGIGAAYAIIVMVEQNKLVLLEEETDEQNKKNQEPDAVENEGVEDNTNTMEETQIETPSLAMESYYCSCFTSCGWPGCSSSVSGCGICTCCCAPVNVPNAPEFSSCWTQCLELSGCLSYLRCIGLPQIWGVFLRFPTILFFSFQLNIFVWSLQFSWPNFMQDLSFGLGQITLPDFSQVVTIECKLVASEEGDSTNASKRAGIVFMAKQGKPAPP